MFFPSIAEAQKIMGTAGPAWVDDFIPYILRLEGHGIPATTPERVGQWYLDLDSGTWYVSSGTTSAADWQNNGSGGTTRNVQDYGASGLDDGNDAYAAITEAIADCQVGDVLHFPRGYYPVSAMVNVNTERVTIVMDGYLVPHGSYSDYLLNVTKPTNVTIVDYQGGNSCERIRVDCQWQSRGVKFTQVDESVFNDVLVLRPLGTGVKLEGMREGSFYGMRIVSGLYRQNYTAPSAWSNATAYTAGQRVRYDYSAWNSGSTYALNDLVKGSDGIIYRSLAGSNTNHDPITDNTWWVWEAHLDFECVLPNTNKDPLSNNTNDGTPADRYWKRVYQHDAALDINQETAPNDGTNSIAFYDLKVRNCDHPELVRIDINSNDSAVRGIHFYGGHIHQMEQLYVDADVSLGQNSGVLVRNYGTVVNVQRGREVNFTNTSIRLGGTIQRCVGVRFGCQMTDKPADISKIIGCHITGEGAGQIGIVSGANVNSPNNSAFPANYFELTGSGKRDFAGQLPDMPYNSIRHMIGTGSPEGVVIAQVGTLYTRIDGSFNTALYLKCSGVNNTGWSPVVNYNGPNGIYVDNTSTAATFTIEQDGTGDSSLQWLLSGEIAFVGGVDNSDGNRWKLWSANDGFSGYHIAVTPANGAIAFQSTITPALTTGNQTINKPTGSVNIAAAGTSVTVTNSCCTVNSIVIAIPATNDATAIVKNVVPGNGSFVITMNAAVTAETRINFLVLS